MESAGEGTSVGSGGVLCPLAGPLPEGEEASGSHYWLTVGPEHIKQNKNKIQKAESPHFNPKP